MENKIFYFCYDHQRPTGGQKLTYQHVDILHKNGFKAWVVHRQQGFRLTWFKNQTPVISMAEIGQFYNPRTDIFVLPEDLGTRINQFPGKKVIYNKNVYSGFSCFERNRQVSYPYFAKDVLAAFAVSEHNKKQLAFAYPNLEIIHIAEGISLDTFQFRSWHTKKPQIAVLGKKASAHWSSLFHILESRGAAGLSRIRDFEWIILGGQTASQVSEILGNALLFVFLNLEEGLPLMALEALASGCITVGYACGPLLECLPAKCRFPHGDFRAIAEFMELVIAAYPADLGQFQEVFDEGRRSALLHGQRIEEQGVLAAWSRVLNKLGLQRADSHATEKKITGVELQGA